MTLKLSWDEFVKLAIEALEDNTSGMVRLQDVKPIFMVEGSHEGDYPMLGPLPDYVEIPVSDE